MTWLISVPVWGEHYLRVFERCAAPALRAAVAHFAAERISVSKLPEIRFIVHTNAEDRVRAALEGCEVEVRPISNKPTYVALQESHADAARSAEPGDVVVFLNADLVVSGNLLSQIAAHIRAGKTAVVLLGIRTTQGAEPPPPGVAPRALLEWAWFHRHQIIRDLELPTGSSMLPTNLFWSRGESTIARGFHLHPAAIVKPPALNFRSTIDGDLLDSYSRDAIHVVTDPDDCALCEVSPPNRRFPVGRPLSVDSVARSMVTRASPLHRWLFEHRIVVRGTGDDIIGDRSFAHDVLARLGGSTFHKQR